MKVFARVAAYALLAGGMVVTSPAFAEGKLLTTNKGMTVYVFDKDAPGKSNCSGGCVTAWPPVSAESMAPSADVTTITRDDGSKQAAFKNQPLYTYAGDQKAGDKNGDGVNNVWHAIQPGQAPKAKAAPKPAEPSSGY